MGVDLYLFCMALGFFGLFAMLALGFGHGIGHSHDGGGATGHHIGGHHSGDVSSLHHTGTAHAGHDVSAHHASAHHDNTAPSFFGSQVFLMLLAPRVWFSLLFGFGAAGSLLRPWISGLTLGAAAVISAWVFERWIVQPVWSFFLRFVSSPAKTLESAMLEEAVALTNFDKQGQGLISVALDGQLRQMLGTLQDNTTGDSGRVRAGDKLIIIGVDSRRNSCTVARTNFRPEQIP